MAENYNSETNIPNNKNFFDDLLDKAGFKGEKKKQIKILILILLLGVLFMTIGSCDNSYRGSANTDNTPVNEKFSTADEEEQLELKLEEVLSKIKGVGDLSVSVTLASGSRTEYAVNASTTVNSTTENSADGSEKITSQTTNNDTVVFEDNNTTPVVVQEIRPKVQGVLIVAEGGDDTKVSSQITQAVSALFDIPVHKVTVCTQE